jgi:hypothetical protein
MTHNSQNGVAGISDRAKGKRIYLRLDLQVFVFRFPYLFANRS